MWAAKKGNNEIKLHTADNKFGRCKKRTSKNCIAMKKSCLLSLWNKDKLIAG